MPFLIVKVVSLQPEGADNRRPEGRGDVEMRPFVLGVAIVVAMAGVTQAAVFGHQL